VYAIDLLGQGQSWPAPDADPAVLASLRYSVGRWVAQLQHFIDDVIGGGPVYVVRIIRYLSFFQACNCENNVVTVLFVSLPTSHLCSRQDCE
jgi:hypothetical protein